MASNGQKSFPSGEMWPRDFSREIEYRHKKRFQLENPSNPVKGDAALSFIQPAAGELLI